MSRSIYINFVNVLAQVYAEELIIDFQEVIGDHSGENIAEVVWGTLILYGIQNKVSLIKVVAQMTSFPPLDYLLRYGQCHKQ